MPDTSKDFHKKLLGRKGERLAEAYLKKQGYKLLKRNYRTPYGEADLVFAYGDEVVFVEVKTRTGVSYGEAKEAVGRDKQERYKRIALFYGGGSEPNARFDVVEVYGKEVRHYPSAF